MNPYDDQTFFSFFLILFRRVISFISGNDLTIATDEVQLMVLSTVAISSAIVGSFLVLKKMTMLANSLSHTILFGIVIAFFLTREMHLGEVNISVLLASAIVMGLVTAFLTEFLHKTARLQEDASTAIIFTTLFALSIILVTLLTKNSHIGTEIVAGNVDALSVKDLYLVLAVLFINVLSVIFFFKELKLISFDPSYASALGYSLAFFNYLLMTLVSITIVSSFRAVGVIMVLSFITGPTLTARFFSHSLKTMIVLSSCVGVFISFIGVALSRHLFSLYGLALSTGGVVVSLITIFFFTILILLKIRKLKLS